MSNGEKIIEHILKNNHVDYIKQYSFSECRNTYKLKFDFAIFDRNELKCLIEYDGLQHYRPIEFFGGQSAFEKARARDEIKDKYCKQNNILLIRIPYYYSSEEISSIIMSFIRNDYRT